MLDTANKRKREDNDSAIESLSGGGEEKEQVVDQIEPTVKKIKTEYDLKVNVVDEEDFPYSGSKLYIDDYSSIEDIWHVKHARKIMLDIMNADLNNWDESEEKTLLDELTERREDIESISLFFAESMIKKATIHDTKFITEMIENMSKTIVDYSKTLEEELMEDFTPCHGSNTVKYWLKYILPEIVKKQNELNLIESNEVDCVKISPEEEKEKAQILNSMQYDSEEENDYAFLLDSCNLSHPEQINAMIDEEEEICEQMEETDDDYIIDHFYNEYLFENLLPDEKQDMPLITSPFKGILTTLQDDNPFLSILEKTMRMFIEEPKEEHHDLKVSPMRLGLSLLILDCLNKELSFAFNRNSAFQMICRPLIRAVLDHFIDFDVKKIYFKQPPKIVAINKQVFSDVGTELAEEEMKHLKYIFDISKPNYDTEDYDSNELDYSDEESELSEDNIDESDDEFENSDLFFEYGEDARDKFRISKYENFKYATCGGDTNIRLAHSEHPLWYSFPLNQKKLAMLKQHQLNSYNPVPLTIDSTSHWLFTEEKVDGEDYENQIPLHEQNIVSLFPNNLGENGMIEAVEHLYYFNSDVRHQPPNQDSLHIDINRIFRRAGNLNYSSGALVEGFLSLKAFISRIIETLMIIKKDDVVTKLDVAEALDICRHPIYPGLQLVEPSEPKYVPFPTPTFTTEPVNSPSCLSDVKLEETNIFYITIPPSDDQTIPLPGDYDTIVNNSTFGDHITLFLKDPNPYNDSFIDLNGHRIEIYTPLIKHRCRSMYDEHFSTPEKRSQGFYLTTDHDFTFDMAYYWIESYYLGSYVSMNGNEQEDSVFNLLFEKYRFTVSAVVREDRCEDELDVLLDNEEYELDEFDPSNKCLTLNKLHNDDETKDFELLFINHPTNEKKTRRVHKYILACRSPFFRKILEGNYSDRVTDHFDISDIFKEEESIDAFLYYLYHNYIVIPPMKQKEFTPRDLYLYNTNDILNNNPPEKEESNTNDENEINLYLSLFISSDYLMVEGLKILCENVIASFVNKDNCVQLLEFSNEHVSETIFEFVDNFLLSSSLILEVPYIINNDISLYYEILSGPTSIDNVSERIKCTLDLADKEESQLYRFHNERLENFHIPQLVSFILRNYEYFSQQESFKQPFKEIQYSETLSVWDYVSNKYNRMNSCF